VDIDEIVILRIKELMKVHKLSQIDLATKAKVNYQNLSRLMNKKRSIVKSDVLNDIAKALGTTGDALKSTDFSISKTDIKDRNELLGLIVSGSATLEQSELREVLAIIDEFNSARGLSTFSTVKIKRG
jgi:transcriptional regulator with XRE-family HTH domain